MAFNWSTFKTRALTAVVFVIVMLVGLLWNQWSFFLLFSFVHFGAWIEYQRLIRIINPDYAKISALHRYGIMIAGWCLLLFFTNDVLSLGNISLSRAGFWLGAISLVLLPLILLLESKYILLKNFFFSLMGLLYVSLPLSLLIDLRTRWIEEQYQLTMTIPLLIIFSIWINDTMAYIVGSIIGKTPLTPISPKKTWEGTLGGIVLTVVVISVLAWQTGRIQVIHASILALLAAVSGTFGDLFESKLKRMAGVKDSGNIMPGHGGFLDRFDSLLFAATIVWFYAVFAFG